MSIRLSFASEDERLALLSAAQDQFGPPERVEIERGVSLSPDDDRLLLYKRYGKDPKSASPS